MRIGEGFEYLNAKAAKGDKSAIEELARIVQPDSVFIWEAFTTLSQARPQGFNGPASIPISEIASYCEFSDITRPRQRDRLLKAIQALDAAFLEWVRNNNGNP